MLPHVAITNRQIRFCFFYTGHHHNSKTRLSWAETFHSSATMPGAPLHMHGCHRTAVSLSVTLTGGGRPVRVRHSTVFQSILKFNEVMPLAFSHCFVTSPLHLPNRASFWNYNGDPCEKGKYSFKYQSTRSCTTWYSTKLSNVQQSGASCCLLFLQKPESRDDG